MFFSIDQSIYFDAGLVLTWFGVVSMGVIATIIAFIRKSSWTIIRPTFQTTFTITVTVAISLILITIVIYATTILICISS